MNNSNWHWLSHHRNKYFYGDVEKKPCVYAIYAYLDPYYHIKKLVYIGKAKNLSRRLSGHHIENLLHKNEINTACRFRYCDNPGILESELIRKVKPIFNFQHNHTFFKNFYLTHMVTDLKRQNTENTL